MENDIVILYKLSFYRRFVDDIYSRWKLVDNVLFDRLNRYHSNIKLTIELNPSNFSDTKLTNINGAYNHFHNILRLFDVLPNFPLTTSGTMDDYYL